MPGFRMHSGEEGLLFPSPLVLQDNPINAIRLQIKNYALLRGGGRSDAGV